MKVEVLVARRLKCGEGPHWDDKNNRLLFVDITGKKCFVFDWETKEVKTLEGMAKNVHAVIPRESNKDEVIICHGLNFEVLNLKTAEREVIAEVDQGSSINDAKCDAAGRIWAGTFSENATDDNPNPRKGAMFCLDKNKVVTKKYAEVETSNGLCWSPDSLKFYHADSIPRIVSAYDYNLETSEVTNKTVAIDVNKLEEEKKFPDGMCIDAEGMVWVALFNGWKVIRCNPNTGEKLSEIKMPVKQPTSCCFAGPNLDQLVITSASIVPDDEFEKQPLAGSVFIVKDVGVRGTKMVSYAG